MYGIVVDGPHVPLCQLVGHVLVGKPLEGLRLRVVLVEAPFLGTYPEVSFVVLRHALDDGRAKPLLLFRRGLVFAVYLLLRVEVVNSPRVGAHPYSALQVAIQSPDGGVAQAPAVLPLDVPGERPRLPVVPVQSLEGAYPDVPLLVLAAPVGVVGTDGGGVVRLAAEVGAPVPLQAVYPVSGVGRYPVASVRIFDDVRDASFPDGVGEFLLRVEDVQPLGRAYEHGVVVYVEPLYGAVAVRHLVVQVELPAVVPEYLVCRGGVQVFREELRFDVLLDDGCEQVFLHVVVRDAPVGHDVDMASLVSRDVVDVVVEYAVGVVFLFLVDLEVFPVVQADPVACAEPHESPLVLVDGDDGIVRQPVIGGQMVERYVLCPANQHV